MARHSFIMVGAGLAGSLFAYLYQLVMVVLLPEDEYGTLLSLISLLAVLSVFTATITFVAAKSTASFTAEGRPAAVSYLWHSLVKRTLVMGLVAFGLAAAASPFVSRFLDLGGPLPFIATFSTLVFAFALSAGLGVMQGLQRFPALGLISALSGFARFAVGALLVYLGFGLVGGLAASPLSCVLALGLTYLLLRNLSQAGQEKVRVDGMTSYAWFTLLAVLAITMLTNFDVVLAKHYLPPEDAGSYSTIAVLGRIAFYAPAGIGVALFPKTAASYESGGNHGRLFLMAVSLTLAVAAVICLGYALLSAHVISFDFTDRYSVAVPYLFKYGLGMSFLAVSSLVMTYFLSLGRTRVAYPLLAAMILQVVLIGFLHSSIDEFVNIMLISGILSSILIVAFYWTVERQHRWHQ